MRKKIIKQGKLKVKEFVDNNLELKYNSKNEKVIQQFVGNYIREKYGETWYMDGYDGYDEFLEIAEYGIRLIIDRESEPNNEQ